MYLVADINVEICSQTGCKLCMQYCPEPNTILYNEQLGQYGAAYVVVDRCKGCGQCTWICDNLSKHHAIKLVMVDQLPAAAFTENVLYGDKSTTAARAPLAQ
jgi:Pyruvate/2-oxoacid:ferredoxin oxidoreductase delta subunit